MSVPVVIGTVAGFGTTISFLPQVFKVMRSENIEGLSIYMMISQCVGTSLWTIYGILKKDAIITSYNSFSVFLVCIIIGRYIFLKRKERVGT